MKPNTSNKHNHIIKVSCMECFKKQCEKEREIGYAKVLNWILKELDQDKYVSKRHMILIIKQEIAKLKEKT